MASDRRRFPFFLTAALLPFLFLASAAATDVEYCRQGRDYPVKVSEVEIVPDPVVSGQPATFKISASTDKSITKGKLVIDVKYFFFHVHSESHDLCDETTCPVTGEFVLAHEQTLPSITPPGSYTLTMKLLDDRNKELTCISFGFSIGFISPLALI
uniref:MD-2-related lipid-recognition domain-containing protein n=1 Tax=Oryza punctata TaxID=4537 RepID=A0A0E0KJX7_ORYPU